MIVGFTGTRDGMTPRQKAAFGVLITSAEQLHHGMCVGADSEAEAIAKQRAPNCCRTGHPASDVPDKYRANCLDTDEVLPAVPAMERNGTIVDACDLLIAAPRALQEELRSGTWATVRYARKSGKPVIILDPGLSR